MRDELKSMSGGLLSVGLIGIMVIIYQVIEYYDLEGVFFGVMATFFAIGYILSSIIEKEDTKCQKK